jgi:hypothetical protein
LEKCAQERVALDAVAAARKALEAKRFIERQAIRQAMIERATAELLQRTTDTDNREVGALTNATMMKYVMVNYVQNSSKNGFIHSSM